MTDRELLEMAAKAAGIDIDPIDAMHEPDEWTCWNPLTSDGDALRLAVKLRLTVKIADHEIEVFEHLGDCLISSAMADGEDYQADTRRAIVRAAAEIGRNMG